MIAFLEGKIESKTDKYAVLNIGGAGYRVFCPESCLADLRLKTKTRLYTYHHVRENAAELYGFPSQSALDFFELLLSVNGVGPKAALAIMSSASVRDLKQAVASGQKTLLTNVSGIGRRTAERILVELKDKVPVCQADIQKLSLEQEALDALVSLGYSRDQGRRALRQVSAAVNGVGQRVKEALKVLGKK